jgi:predicted anti-sigma-YlaC factor YlaD
MNGHMSEDIQAYADRELSITRMHAIEAHLADCAECRALLDQQQRLAALLQAWKPLPESVAPVQIALPEQARPVLPRVLKLSWQLAPMVFVGIWTFGQALAIVGSLLQGVIHPVVDSGLWLLAGRNPWMMTFSFGSYLIDAWLELSSANNLVLQFSEGVLISIGLSLGVSLLVGVLFSGWLASGWAYYIHQKTSIAIDNLEIKGVINGLH